MRLEISTTKYAFTSELPVAIADPATGAITLSPIEGPLPAAPYLESSVSREMPAPIPGSSVRAARVAHAAPAHAVA